MARKKFISNFISLSLVMAMAVGLSNVSAMAMAQPTSAKMAQPCGSGAFQSTCMGAINAPEKHRANFIAAATLAIDALYSPGFKADLAAFYRDHAQNGSHAAAWEGFDSAATPDRLQAAIEGQSVTTYGGIIAWFKKIFAGNMAYDGTQDGPIRLNRHGLKRSSASLANTFAHEVAHRIGLSHPSSGDDLSIASCEPPYVIGSLVEKQATPGWRRQPSDCPLLPSR